MSRAIGFSTAALQTLGECTSVPDSEFVIPDGVDAAIVERDSRAAGTQRGAESTLLLPSLTLTLERPRG